MTSLAWLVPAALCLGLLALAGFVWALNSGQFDDLEGAAWRALADDNVEPPPEQPVSEPKGTQSASGANR
jgi:cbb3-type cytochrome oxidase maturation protein